MRASMQLGDAVALRHSRRLQLVVVAKGGENHLFLGWCLFMCSAKWSERANERSQMRHLNGFWPVCLR